MAEKTMAPPIDPAAARLAVERIETMLAEAKAAAEKAAEKVTDARRTLGIAIGAGTSNAAMERRLADAKDLEVLTAVRVEALTAALDDARLAVEAAERGEVEAAARRQLDASFAAWTSERSRAEASLAELIDALSAMRTEHAAAANAKALLVEAGAMEQSDGTRQTLPVDAWHLVDSMLKGAERIAGAKRPRSMVEHTVRLEVPVLRLHREEAAR